MIRHLKVATIALILPVLSAANAQETTNRTYEKRLPRSANGDRIHISKEVKHLPTGADRFYFKVVPRRPIKIEGASVAAITATVSIQCGGHGDSSWTTVEPEDVRPLSASGERVLIADEARPTVEKRFKAALRNSWFTGAQCILQERLAELPG